MEVGYQKHIDMYSKALYRYVIQHQGQTLRLPCKGQYGLRVSMRGMTQYGRACSVTGKTKLTAVLQPRGGALPVGLLCVSFSLVIFFVCDGMAYYCRRVLPSLVFITVVVKFATDT